ncbi:hypothetical protein GLS40_04070 [Pseudooceanicola sp. 216_PA32_1]|uniref:Uncharacterized protein n=1 Tax=Pseudooceanicola pacificus TaxID=2676438 RepID=A0A844W8R7_9RHOB|nr:hypothetical protein [Pseudooceanicola pacificus]MWB77193.1 hypothetical protein [Pseudooceanicola pacificus]
MKRLILPLVCSALLATQAVAQDDPAPTPGMMQQVMLSEQLIALGMERDDPVLMLAALRLRASLDNTTVAPAEAFTDKDTLIGAAKAAAAGQDGLLSLIEDAETEKSRMYCYPSWGRTICY